jgi:formylglycine-generating enzyme required for sulfatase activity
LPDLFNNIMDTLPSAIPQNLNLHRYRRTNKSYTEDLGSGVKLTLMLIPGGEFLMGAPADEPESDEREQPQHLVRVSQFLMGRYPVTQAQWRVVAGYKQINKELKLNPSNFKGDNRPVENVSWNDAQEFCRRLSVKSEKNYQLPSEAQWEYACRAKTVTPFHFGEIITTEVANYNDSNESQGKYQKKTTDVGSFPANDWGLHDMHGNVWEWCEDDWHGSYEGAPVDGSAWVDAADQASRARILRGGSWYFYPRNCRSAVRDLFTRDFTFDFVGFRVCCEPPRILLSP